MKLTGATLPDGRPIWKCDACGARVWGHKIAPHSCDGPAPTAANTPCSYRGDVYTSVKVADCCKSAVFRCGQEDDAFCVIKEENLKINDKVLRCCRTCPFRLGST